MQRGYPLGSSEDDWSRAEQILQAIRTQALGSR
ncbi:MAG: DUF2934 domain-containing protein [Bryobacteraceae bacterium]